MKARLTFVLGALALAACADNPPPPCVDIPPQDLAACVDNPPQALPALDVAFHRCRVQPVVDARCSMLACHGDVRRPFHTFTRNRMRLVGSNEQRNLALSPEELQLNLDSALGFVSPEAPDESWLLLKPLDADAGGYFHQGKELYAAGDVFLDAEDPDYVTLREWIAGGTEDPACVYPGTEGAP